LLILLIVTVFIISLAIILNFTQGSFFFHTSIGSFLIPGLFLSLLAIGLSVVIWIVEFKLRYRGKMALSCLLAGPIIIIGYFLYEVTFLQIAIEGALFEIPFNIAQVIFGTFIAVPIVTYLDELGILPVKENMGLSKIDDS